jgi:hypothetical protein
LAITCLGFALLVVAGVVQGPEAESSQHLGWALRLLAAIPVAIVYVAILAVIARFLIPNDAMRYMGLLGALLFSVPVAYVWLGVVNVMADGPGKPRVVRVLAEERNWRNTYEARLEWVDAPGTTFTIDGMLHVDVGEVACMRHFPGALGFDYVRTVPESECGLPVAHHESPTREPALGLRSGELSRSLVWRAPEPNSFRATSTRQPRTFTCPSAGDFHARENRPLTRMELYAEIRWASLLPRATWKSDRSLS